MVNVETTSVLVASLFLVGSFLVIATVYFDIDIPFLPDPALRGEIQNLEGEVSSLFREVSNLRDALLNQYSTIVIR